MSSLHFKPARALTIAAAVIAGPALGLGLAATEVSATKPHEITITVERLKALDKFDAFSKADFYARVTIDGRTQTTPVIRQQVEVAPNWVLRETLPPGKYDLKMEIFDKDASIDDPIDVNPIDGRRTLEATIDTRKCRLMAYGKTYRCGLRASVSGKERKSAEVTFKVDVKR